MREYPLHTLLNTLLANLCKHYNLPSQQNRYAYYYLAELCEPELQRVIFLGDAPLYDTDYKLFKDQYNI
ncbi:hypothetical protein AU255_07955 [Methyloprofundus sedimenti]|uniref:Uncharacterized protein n=1 Tax=Methyloprofundus sedimenti TaxID=1420851 RepID=A0A1V8M869_9GAMM|nr:hypothetical protein AU255_07955 [Methyloprofundus sedimenti]